jgi:hypothetical protein
LPPSQQARLKELQEQVAQLPAWPVYGNVLDPHQYDNLSLDVVRVMTSAILDTKSALEKRIAEMVRPHRLLAECVVSWLAHTKNLQNENENKTKRKTTV